MGCALGPIGEGQRHRVHIGQGERVVAVGGLDELGLLGLHDHEPLALRSIVSVCEDGSADEKNSENEYAESGKEGPSFPRHSYSVDAPSARAVKFGCVNPSGR